MRTGRWVILLGLLPSIAVAAGFWPSFEVLKRNYPRYTEYTNRQMFSLAGLGENVYGKPSSVVRISYALINSGREIDIKQGECNWDGSIAYASEDRHKYITKGDTLRCWLEKNLGPATVVSVNKLKYHGKKGIIIFEDCRSFGSKPPESHADLWDIGDCLGQCYSCNDIRMFSLP